MIENKKNIKIQINYNGKKTTFFETPETFSDLTEKIYLHLGLNKTSHVITTLHYTDEEGDKISVDNNVDYLESLNYASESNNSSITFDVNTVFFSTNDWELLTMNSYVGANNADPILESIIISENKEEENKEKVENKKNIEELNTKEVKKENILNDIMFNLNVFKANANEKSKEAVKIIEDQIIIASEKIKELNIPERVNKAINTIPENYNNLINNIRKMSEENALKINNNEIKIEDNKKVKKAPKKEIKKKEVKKEEIKDKKVEVKDKKKDVKKNPTKTFKDLVENIKGKLGLIDKKPKKVAKPKKNSLTYIQNEAAKEIKNKIKKNLNELCKTLTAKAIEESNKQLEELYNKRILELQNREEQDRLKFGKLLLENKATQSCSECKGLFKRDIVYKCCVCPDFSICEDCEEKLYSTHTHKFIKIRKNKEENKKLELIKEEERDDIEIKDLDDNKLEELAKEVMTEKEEKEENITESNLYAYEVQAKIIANDFNLGNMEDKLLKALIENKGNVDKALECLFN